MIGPHSRLPQKPAQWPWKRDGDGWELAELTGRQDDLAYIRFAQSRGLEYVAFDPRRSLRLYSLAQIIALLTEDC